VDTNLGHLVSDENNSWETTVANRLRLNNSISMLQHLLCEVSDPQPILVCPVFEISEFVLMRRET
jgi:hypothetical protein